MSRYLALAVLVGLVLCVAPGGAAAAEPAPKPQVCGIPPGDGAYSIIRVWNISCDRARQVAGNAFNRFCDENPCDTPPTGGFVKGRVTFNDWDCKVKLAYEFARSVCEKPGARFVSESGA